MTTLPARGIVLLALLGAGFAAPATATAQPDTAARHYEQFTAYFAARVDAYVALHRRLERLVAPETIFSDPRQDYAAREALADMLRAARPGAGEGDIFCPDVADVFRVRIAHTLRAIHARPVDLLRGEGDDEEVYTPPVVNERFDWLSGAVMWPSLLRALPELPEELEYRLVGADLILLDVHTGVVVDILRDALGDV